MTIRTLLAPVTGGDHDHVTLRAAFALARIFDAHVDVLFARLSPSEAVPLVGEGMSSSVVEQMMQSAESEWSLRSAAAERAFHEALAATSVTLHVAAPGPGGPTASWRDVIGRQEELVARFAHVNDLVVLGGAAPGSDDLQFTMTLEAALLNGGRPVFLMRPRAVARNGLDVGRRCAIAWRGSADCARAVAGAMPFLQRAELVTVLTAATSRTHPARAEELVDALAWRGIAAERRWVDVAGSGVGPALLRHCASIEADLLVMGGYGHSRMREMIVGGVTRFVLNHAELPVILAH